jgi:hypothetical protein
LKVNEHSDGGRRTASALSVVTAVEHDADVLRRTLDEMLAESCASRPPSDSRLAEIVRPHVKRGVLNKHSASAALKKEGIRVGRETAAKLVEAYDGCVDRAVIPGPRLTESPATRRLLDQRSPWRLWPYSARWPGEDDLPIMTGPINVSERSAFW